MGWAVSSVVLGFMIGAFSGQFITNRLGRKKALIITGGLVFLAGIGTAFPYNFTMFILCRIAGGSVSDWAQLLPPCILVLSAVARCGENTRFLSDDDRLRDLFPVYLVNALVAGWTPDAEWATQYSWRYMPGAMSVPGCVFMGLAFFLPESLAG